MMNFKLMKQLPEQLAEVTVHVNNMVFMILILLKGLCGFSRLLSAANL